MNAINASMVVSINRDTTGIPRSASVGATGCTPSSIQYDGTASLNGDYCLTYSVNGSPAQTYTQTATNLMNSGLGFLYLTRDNLKIQKAGGGMVAFYAPTDGISINQIFTIQGIASDVAMAMPAVTDVVFMPTPNPTGTDLYQYMVGSQIKPTIELHSCATVFTMGM